jgi:hypothetical protein
VVITEEEISKIFKQLLENLIARENAQEWANEKEELLEKEESKFLRTNDDDKIFDALEYIQMYALKENPQAYLFSKVDLSNYIKSNNWKV